jgi:hypothetical protein
MLSTSTFSLYKYVFSLQVLYAPTFICHDINGFETGDLASHCDLMVFSPKEDARLRSVPSSLAKRECPSIF